jgi:PAS domain S-box-containing protein
MWTTEQLLDEHQLLRQKIGLLYAWLSSSEGDATHAERAAASLIHLWQRHLEHEDPLIRLTRDRQPPHSPSSATIDDHARQHRMVTALLELFHRSHDALECRGTGANAAGALMELLQEEERELFPLIEEAISSSGGPAVERPPSEQEPMPDAVTGAMTVGQVLATWPSTREVFTRFDVDPEDDHDARLDSLHWRRGLHVPALLVGLNHAVTRPHLPAPPSLAWESCDAIMVLDEERRILAMNRTMERWLGRPRREVVGRRECSLLLGCEDEAGGPMASRADRCPGLRAMRLGTPVTSATYVIHRGDGQRRLINASYTPVRPSPTGPACVVAILRDVGPAPNGLRSQPLGGGI